MMQQDPSVAGSTVLIVDDNPSNLGVLFEYLEDRGLRVLVALSGDQALLQLNRSQPDLILLDVVMPGLDGFETCRRVKKLAEIQDIPVIFMSALTDPEDKVRAFSAGAVDYITKPINEKEVLARVNTQLSLRALHRELGRRNETLEQQREELRARNQELGAFGHMVAHDLNDHLSGIVGYTRVLLDQLNARGEPVSVEDLQTILTGGVAMGELFEALIVLGGVSDREVEHTPLDMGAIVERVKQDLVTHNKACGSQICGPDRWPTALGYAPWVERVWSNYMTNGLKYGGEPAQLVIGAETNDGDSVRFWIRDNGDGIPEEAMNTVFEPFTRLQANHAAGHGLGLAIVRRIVNKLGGRVGARRLDGGGTEFFFTLPAVPRSESP